MTSTFSYRRVSLTAGVLYLLTFVSVPTLVLYSKVKSADYILGNGSDTSALTGSFLEIVVALTAIGTAVVLYKVLKKQNETASIALIAVRVLEATCIFIGVAIILTIVALKQTGAGSGALATSNMLGILYDRVFLISQSLLPGINDLLLGFLLYQSRLVPRALSVIGLAGGPLLIIGFLAVISGVIERGSVLAGLSAIGVFFFELFLGIWLVVKGFDPVEVAKLDKKLGS